MWEKCYTGIAESLWVSGMVWQGTDHNANTRFAWQVLAREPMQHLRQHSTLLKMKLAAEVVTLNRKSHHCFMEGPRLERILT